MSSYLEIEDGLQVSDRYGFHVRDIGLLASALARPGTTVMGVEAYPQLTMKAAALLESVARFHPLIDGNKRTAWTLMVLMLWINGHQHNFRTDEGFDLVVGVDAGSVPLERSASLIAAHLIPREAAFDFLARHFRRSMVLFRCRASSCGFMAFPARPGEIRKKGVDSVNTFAAGLGLTGAGLARTRHVSGNSQSLQRLCLGASCARRTG